MSCTQAVAGSTLGSGLAEEGFGPAVGLVLVDGAGVGVSWLQPASAAPASPATMAAAAAGTTRRRSRPVGRWAAGVVTGAR
ncbi:MAG TPA: hypothetical protein VF140_05940 [Phycicoccus sp.]